MQARLLILFFIAKTFPLFATSLPKAGAEASCSISCRLDEIYNENFQYPVARSVMEAWFAGYGFPESSGYNAEEQQALLRDIDELDLQIEAQQPLQKREALISVGAPGAGKTTLMEKQIAGKALVYLDPDAVSLKRMKHTHLRQIAAGDGSKEARLASYLKWRAASNASAHWLLAKAIKAGYALAFGSTSTGPFTGDFFAFLKKQGYRLQLLYVATPAAVRWNSIHERDKTFVQATEQDIMQKGFLLPLLTAVYFEHADAIDFYFRAAAQEAAKKAAQWERGSKLQILDQSAYEGLQALHDENLPPEQRAALSWAKVTSPFF